MNTSLEAVIGSYCDYLSLSWYRNGAGELVAIDHLQPFTPPWPCPAEFDDHWVLYCQAMKDESRSKGAIEYGKLETQHDRF